MREKMSMSKKLSIVNVAIICSLMVLAFIILLIGSVTGSEIISCSFVIIVGFLMLWICVYDIIRLKRCNTEVIAVLEDCVKTRGVKSGPRYTPVFSYIFDGKIYNQQSFVSYSRRRFRELFVKGEEYKIRIDPQLPTCCVYGQGGNFVVNIILGFSAFVFILVGFIAEFL